MRVCEYVGDGFEPESIIWQRVRALRPEDAAVRFLEFSVECGSDLAMVRLCG